MSEFNIDLMYTEDIKTFRERISNYIEFFPILKQDEARIEILNKLHQINKTSPYLIGSLLSQLEEFLQNQFYLWKQWNNVEFEQWNVIKDLKGRPARSLHEWFSRYKETVLFSYSMAREYINIYENSDIDISDKLGAAKEIALNRIPKKHASLREEIQNLAIVNDWTVKAVQSEVESRLRELSLPDEKKDIKAATESIGISLVMAKDNIVNVVFLKKEAAEAGFLVLTEKLEEIKEAIYNMLRIIKGY